MLIPVIDPADPRLAPFMNVRDRDLRQTHGDAFIAEGESVLAVFLSAGSRFRPEALLIAGNRVDTMLALSPPDNLPIFVADQGVMDAIVGFPIHRGILALGRRAPAPSPDALLAASQVLGQKIYESSQAQAAGAGAAPGGGEDVVEAEFSEQPPALLVGLGPVDDTPAGRRHMAEEEILTDRQAEQKGVGGEVLAYVW